MATEFQCFGEVPICGSWKLYDMSLRVHIAYNNSEVIHYVDGKPKTAGFHPLRHYFHVKSHDVASHIASEIKAWSALSGWSIEEIIMAVRTQMGRKL